MKGLFYKDMIMLVRAYRMYLLMAVFFIVLGCVRPDNSFWAVYGIFFMSTLVSTLISFDDQTKWNSYCDILPLKRADAVTERYLFSIALNCVLIVLFVILGFALRQLDSSTVLISAAGMFVFAALSAAISMPIYFKFGAQKGQLVRMIVIVAMVFCGMMIINFANPVMEALASRSALLLPACAAAVMAIYLLSWKLSVRICENREVM